MESGKRMQFFKSPKTKERLFIFALVIIPLIHFAVFWVYVNGATIFRTLFVFSEKTGKYTWNGLDKYVEIFREWVLGIPEAGQSIDTVAPLHRTFWNSFRAIYINLILYPIVIVTAFAFYKKIRFEKFFRICFYLPQLISISVLAIMFRNLFDPLYGPISSLINSITGKKVEFLTYESGALWPLIYSFAIWTGLGANVIMLSGAMSRIPADIGEYCQLEGVGFWRELVQIVIPLIMPTLGVYLVNILLSVFAFMMQPLMILGGIEGDGQYFDTIGWYIFRASSQGVKSAHEASTLGLLLTIMITPFVVGLRVFIKKVTPDVQF